MIEIEEINVWGFKNAIQGTELELLKCLFDHYQDKGYHKSKYGYELHSKPYITVTTEFDAVLELSYRKIRKIKECCKTNNLELNNAVLYKRILVFSTGQFITIRNCKIMKQRTENNDYLWINTGDNNTEQSHRVIAKCFIPNPNNLPCINHKNGIKNDNRVENLEWCTHSDNTLHAYRTGLEKKVLGEDHHGHKLNRGDVDYIKEHFIKGSQEYGAAALGRKFGVDKSTIEDAYYGKTWKEV